MNERMNDFWFVSFDSLCPINNLSVTNGQGLPGLNQYYARINVLAQGHNAVMPVRLEPTAPQSGVKHTTTETLDPKRMNDERMNELINLSIAHLQMTAKLQIYHKKIFTCCNGISNFSI